MNIRPDQVDNIIKNLSDKIKVVLIYGSNEGLISTLSKQFIAAISKNIKDPFNVSYLEFGNIANDFGTLSYEFNSQSLMGGRRVVIVKDITEGFITNLKELLASSNSNTLLVLTSPNLKTKSAIVNLAKNDDKFYGIGCYDDRDKDINTFVSSFISKNGLKIDNATFQILCARLSNDRRISNNELEKLITYLGDEKNISLEDVITVISDTSAASQDDLCYFVGLGLAQKAISSYNRLVFEGEKAASLIRKLSYYFMNLLEYSIKYEKGETIDNIISSIRPPVMFFRKEQLIFQIKVWNRKRVLGALALLYQTERDCKTTDYPDEEVASFAIIKIANRAASFK